jgi:transposase
MMTLSVLIGHGNPSSIVYIYKVAFRGAMTGHNPTDRSKLGKTKRHILTDKKGIPLSVVISSSASTHDIKLVTSVVNNVVIKQPSSYKTKTGRGRRRKLQHLCLDKAYNSQPEEQELIKRGYVLHIPYKRKRDVKEEREAKITIQHCSNRKKHSAKRWVVERTNSWHNKFRKLLTRYEKKSENYLGLIQLSGCMIIYRKIILG